MQPIVISGQVPAQKNRKIISRNRKTGNMFLRQDDRTKQWQSIALFELMQQKIKPITAYPTSMVCVFHMKDGRQRDLDNCLSSVLDVLKKGGIIEDDDWKHICPITLDCSGVDRENPRVEIYFDEAEESTPIPAGAENKSEAF
jgi:Holliday junction resolvase RusA-like endonuclease